MKLHFITLLLVSILCVQLTSAITFPLYNNTLNKIFMYELNSSSGSTARDSINYKDGLFSQAPTWEISNWSGFGNAARFNTSSNYIHTRIEGNSTLWNNFSLEFRITPSVNQSRAIFMWGTSVNGTGIAFDGTKNGTISWLIAGCGQINNLGAHTALQKRSHYVFTRNDSTWTFYKDGVAYSSRYCGLNSTKFNTGNLTFGADLSGYFAGNYTGQLDQFILWNRALNITEVQLANSSDSEGNLSANPPDILPPSVTINTPSNNQVIARTANFNITLDEQGGTVLYTLNGGLHNKTMTTTDNLTYIASNSTLSVGVYTFIVYANDTSGNRNDNTNLSFYYVANSMFSTVQASWSFVGNMDTSLSKMSLPVVRGDMIYIFGGNNAGADQGVRQVRCYNITSRVFTAGCITDIPSQMLSPNLWHITYNGQERTYIFGFFNNTGPSSQTDGFWYNWETGVWNSSFNHTIGDPGQLDFAEGADEFVLNGNSSLCAYGGTGGPGQDDIWCYNITADNSYLLARNVSGNLNGSEYGAVAQVADGVYFMLSRGRNMSQGDQTSSRVSLYNITTGIITLLSTPIEQEYAAYGQAFIDNRFVHIIGGHDDDGVNIDYQRVYDIQTDTWFLLPEYPITGTSPLWAPACTKIMNKGIYELYCFGGVTSSNPNSGTLTDDIWVYRNILSLSNSTLNTASSVDYDASTIYIFNITVNSSLGASSVIFNLNGINYTSYNLSNTLYQYNITGLGGYLPSTFTYYWFVNDSANDYALSESNSLYIASLTYTQTCTTLTNTGFKLIMIFFSVGLFLFIGVYVWKKGTDITGNEILLLGIGLVVGVIFWQVAGQNLGTVCPIS